MAWRLRPAQAADLPDIEALVTSEAGDAEDLQAGQFVLAEDADGSFLGCGRLRSYLDCTELASLAVVQKARSRGIGGGIVNSLLQRHQGPIYLICADVNVGFFRRAGFELIPHSEMPEGLTGKWRHYVAQSEHMNLMRRG